MTFGEWLNIWFETYKKSRITANGATPVEVAIRLHTTEELKSKSIEDIKVIDIDRCISLLKPSRTQKCLHDTLKSALFKAFALGYIKENISILIEPVYYNVNSTEPLSYNDLFEFLHRIKGHKLEYLFYFLFYTGVRRSEALRVQWQDIDYRNKTIFIRGSKTKASKRIIPLTKDLSDLLLKIPKESQKLFNYLPDYCTKQFKKLCPLYSLRALRTTFATVCAENGVHPSACQRMLGHSKIDTTMRIYTKVRSEFCSSEMQKVEFLKYYEKNEKQKE